VTFLLVPLAPLASHAAELACANPAYEGFGGATTGGAGATVVAVTSLSDSGPGSLREALSQGNRCIVFEVGGEIRLRQKLTTGGSNITIDGLTAPAPGITITPVGLAINHDNVIVRDIRIAIVDAVPGTQDGIGCGGADHVVIDHVSVRGASDENIGVNGCTNVTVSWSILASPHASHPANLLIIGADTHRISIHHNLFVDANRRSPWLNHGNPGGLQADIRNNLMWEVGGGSSHHGTAVYDGSTANIVGNYYKARATCAGDPDCQKRMITICQEPDFAEDTSFCGARGAAGGVYVAGNVSGDGWSSHLNSKGTRTTPWAADAIRTTDACTAAASVRTGAGVRPLDATDAAYVNAIDLPGCPRNLPAARPGPDLAVTAVSMPGTLAVGTSFPITFEIANRGTAPARPTAVRISLSVDDRVSADDVVLRFLTVPALAGGGSRSESLTALVPATVKPGAHHVLVEVDADATATEGDGTNEVTVVRVAITGGATQDTPAIGLTMVSMPVTLAVGARFPVQFSVANHGRAAATDTPVGIYLSEDDRVSADDVVLRLRTVSPLAPGAWESHSLADVIPVTVTPGSYSVLLAIDPDAGVTGATGDNVTVIPVTVTVPGLEGPSKPDLVMTATWMPRTLPRETRFPVQFSVANQGATWARDSVVGVYLSIDDRVSPDDVVLRLRAVSPLAGAGWESHSLAEVIPASVMPGSYHVLLVVDADAAVAEADEANNTTVIPVTVR
jgi:pectate lyase